MAQRIPMSQLLSAQVITTTAKILNILQKNIGKHSLSCKAVVTFPCKLVKYL